MGKAVSSLVACLKTLGVTHAFGIPGKAIAPIIYEMDRQGIRYVLSRHECGAGYEAAGYALMKRTLGVAIGTSGPGGTHLLTAAGQAKAYNLPVLFITGHPSMKNTGKAQGQDSSLFGTDLVRMFEPVTLFSARVDRADLLPTYLTHALQKAFSGSRGPVHLTIPGDVLMEEIEPFTIELADDAPHFLSSQVKQALPLLEKAQRPVLFLGKGVHASRAYDEVRELAERFGIPVMTTPGGKGTFPTEHPLSLGGFGLGGTVRAQQYMQSGVDLLIVIGTKLSDMSMAGFTPELFPQQVIQFDYDLTFIGKSLPVPTLPIQGDAKTNLRHLLEIAEPIVFETYPEVAAGVEAEGPMERVEGERLFAGEALRALRRHLPQDAVLIGDDGSHSFHAIKEFTIHEPGTFFFDDVFGAMGHAIGYAVGAKLAAPERTIVCLTGDGCMFMQGTEVSVAVNEGAAVIFVVMNNGRLDMVEKAMAVHIGNSIGAIYNTELNAKLFAESMGADAFTCQTVDDIERAVAFALGNEGRPTVIEILVDREEIPPTLARER